MPVSGLRCLNNQGAQRRFFHFRLLLCCFVRLTVSLFTQWFHTRLRGAARDGSRNNYLMAGVSLTNKFNQAISIPPGSREPGGNYYGKKADHAGEMISGNVDLLAVTNIPMLGQEAILISIS